MKKLSEQFVTKQQLQLIMKSWDSRVEVPAKGSKSIVCFPWQEWVEIVWTEYKSDVNKRLYRIDYFRA